MGMASVCIDSRKLHNVMTKLAKMKLAAVVLALWGLQATKNCSKPILGNESCSFPKTAFSFFSSLFFCFFFVLQKQNAEWSGQLAASRDLIMIKEGFYEEFISHSDSVSAIVGWCLGTEWLCLYGFFILGRWEKELKEIVPFVGNFSVTLFLFQNNSLIIEEVLSYYIN